MQNTDQSNLRTDIPDPNGAMLPDLLSPDRGCNTLRRVPREDQETVAVGTITLTVEAWITPAEAFATMGPFQSWPGKFRAAVKTGDRVTWQWFDTRQQALEWARATVHPIPLLPNA